MNKSGRLAMTGAAIAAVTLMLSAGLAGGAGPADGAREVHHGHGLPIFDIRRANDRPTPAAQKALDAYKASPVWALRQADLERLRRAVPTVAITDHDVTGGAYFVRSTYTFLTAPSKRTPVEIARDFVATYPALFGVSVLDLDRARLSRDYATSEGLMHHLTFQQTIDGIDVFDGVLFANVTGRGELITIGGAMLPAPSEVGEHVIDEFAALRQACANLGVSSPRFPTPGRPEGADQHRRWEKDSPDFGSFFRVETKKVYFARTREHTVPAWWLLVPTADENYYEMVVDAVTGEVLFRQNHTVHESTQPMTFRVYPHDSPAPWSPGPTGPVPDQAPFIERDLITVLPAEITPYSPNGWINDGDNRTIGNNTDTYLDASNDNSGSDADRAIGTPAPERLFDFAINLSAAPSTYRNSVITNLFYHANRYHDRLYALGFDEAAGNFQQTNFSGQGVGNDLVHCHSQDGSGTNNANWSGTGVDGSANRIQMYIFTTTAASPDRDGSLDTDVIYHELSHGLSYRLLNTPTGGQTRSMGEGWGDFFGTCLNAEATDDLSGTYTTGGWLCYEFNNNATFNTNYYFGIRRYPYTTDMTKFPLTFADQEVMNVPPGIPTSPLWVGIPPNEVHMAGEIWAGTLIDCRAHMAATEGFNANHVIMQLAVDGMKIDAQSHSTSSMLDERDCILIADNVRYGGAHRIPLWRAFARRGMGEFASCPAGGGQTGLVEDFTVPQRVIFTFPGGTPEQINPSSGMTFTVETAPFNLSITPSSGQVHYSIDNGPFNVLSMTQTAEGRYTATLPGSPCFSTVRYYVSVDTTVGRLTEPSTAPASAFSALTFTDTTVYADETFETNTGWTTGPNTASAGNWNRMDPQGTSNNGTPIQPEDDHTPDPGAVCWVTDGNAGVAVGSADVDNGITILTSPTFNLSSAPLVVVEYWRWHMTGAGTSVLDPFYGYVSNNNGASWTQIDSVPVGAPVDPNWRRARFTLSAATVPTTAQVRFRVTSEDTIGGGQNFVESAFDDFKIFRYNCDTTVPCDPDYDQNGVADQDDVSYLVNVIAGGPNPTGRDPDFNQDGVADQDDYRALVGVVAGGPCP